MIRTVFLVSGGFVGGFVGGKIATHGHPSLGLFVAVVSVVLVIFSGFPKSSRLAGFRGPRLS